MITQVACRNGFPPCFHSRIGLLLVWAFGAGVGLGLTSRCEAAKIGNEITPFDRSRAVLLADGGQALPLPSDGHRPPAYPNGESPTYLAFPLYGGEHLPGNIPRLDAGPQPGATAVGPLDLTAQLKANLDTALDASGLAVVDTPDRNYLVEFLPRVAALRSGSTWPTGGSQAAGGNTPADSLLRFFTGGSGQLVTWSKSGLAGLEQSLGIGTTNETATKPSLHRAVAAQELIPPHLAEGSATPLAAPIPEPSTWLVFGVMLGAGALRQGLRRRSNREP